MTLASCWCEARVALVPSADIGATELEAVTTLMPRVTLLGVGRRNLQVSFELAEDVCLAQLVMRLDYLAHNERKSCGKRVYSLLITQRLEPSLKSFYLWILLGCLL